MFERIWRLYIEDMTRYAEQVIAYTRDVDQAAFVAERMRYDATIRNLELIGEACAHVPIEVRTSNPEIPWRKIVALRNALIHGYLGIDDDLLWSVIRDDVPELRDALKRLLEQQPD